LQATGIGGATAGIGNGHNGQRIERGHGTDSASSVFNQVT